MADKSKQAILNKARTDKFLLSLTVPEALKTHVSKVERAITHKSYTKVMPDTLQYSVYGVIVPTISIPQVDVSQYGQSLRVSSHTRPPYENITVNFKVDNQFNNYWYIWRWLDVLNDTKESSYNAQNQTRKLNEDRNYLEDYQTDFSLIGMNEYNKNVIKFTYTRAFPVSLSPISYNYQSPAEIDSGFTFSFFQLQVELL